MHQDWLVPQEPQVPPVHLDLRDPQVLQEQVACRGQLELLEQQELLVQPVPQVQLEHQGLLDHLV